MMAPPRKLTLVHAVQRPVAAAAFDPDVKVTRKLGETSARLEGNLVVHSESTAHVDLRATWEEIIDLVHEAEPRVEERHADAARVPVNYGQQPPLTRQKSLLSRIVQKRMKLRKLAITETPDALETVHEIGDTKCHFVTYDPVATTRYLEYFPPAVIADKANVETPGVPRTFVMPCSDAPPEPEITQILPAFRFTGPEGNPNQRTRLGGTVRVYLKRPWFRSGAGERLAVVLHPAGGQVLGEDRNSYSMWGRDPAWSKAAPTPLAHSMFNTSDTPVTPLGNAGVAEPLSQMIRGVTLPGGTKKADILVILPTYNKARKEWYVDIELKEQKNYFPFLRLALARYQPHGIEGAQLSDIVLADFLQLTPDRTATVVPGPTQIDVKVVGVGANNEANGAKSIGVSATVQWCAASAGELGWQQPVAWTELTATTASGVTTWQAKVPRPAAQPGTLYRVAIIEFEWHASDEGANLGKKGQRFTYLDLFPI
jgi:hypothetical protein